MLVSGTFASSVQGSSTSPVIIDDDNAANKFATQLRSLGVHVYSDEDLTAHLDKMEFLREGGFG